jgi:hypothetical protein
MMACFIAFLLLGCDNSQPSLKPNSWPGTYVGTITTNYTLGDQTATATSKIKVVIRAGAKSGEVMLLLSSEESAPMEDPWPATTQENQLTLPLQSTGFDPSIQVEGKGTLVGNDLTLTLKESYLDSEPALIQNHTIKAIRQ